MASRRFLVIIVALLCQNIDGKLFNRTSHDAKSFTKAHHGGSSILFVDELKQTLEKYLFGICPQGYKMPMVSREKNFTVPCDLDFDQNELAARFASLALRAHSTRGECPQLSLALASTFSELARTAAERQQAFGNNASLNENNKKRKLSKSQKAKLQAKQRTALAVKKKAAAQAAAQAAKISS